MAYVHPSASRTSAGVLFTIDSDPDYRTVVVQVISAGTSCTITYEMSNDGVTWHQVTGQNSTGSQVTTTSSTGHYVFPLLARYFRARISTYGSGTVTVNGYMRKEVSENPGVQVTNAPGVIATLTSSSVVGGTVHRIKSAANVNATLVSNTGRNVYQIFLQNNGASTRFVRFYNKSSAPVTSDTPLFTVVLPAGAERVIQPSAPIRFGSGLAYNITGAVADNDATAVGADEVHGFILYG